MDTSRKNLFVIPLLLAVVVTLFAVWSGAAAGAPRERVIEIRAQQFSYNPGVIEVNRGDRLVIRLIATDVAHGFYLDGYELKTSALPGQDGILEFVADRPGRFMFRCSLTCGSFHPYMIGWLRVRPNVFMNASYLLTAMVAAGAVLFMWRSKEGGV